MRVFCRVKPEKGAEKGIDHLGSVQDVDAPRASSFNSNLHPFGQSSYVLEFPEKSIIDKDGRKSTNKPHKSIALLNVKKDGGKKK